MSWGKIAGYVVTAIATGVTAYVVGGEKYKDKEDRSDFKSGYNKGKGENYQDIKNANAYAEKLKRENAEFIKHQEQVRALIVLGLAVAGCKTSPVSDSTFKEICTIAFGLAHYPEKTIDKLAGYRANPPSMRTVSLLAFKAGLSEHQCSEMIKDVMYLMKTPSEKQVAFENEWKLLRKTA
ncbi:hypothetical protein [Photobacterium damselae]|uniref:Uncharacterized protein n=2 Tax=Photobacterium damselae TaxID=38293 RepID=A0A7Y7UED9_PHODD|nr:hypothetical protein [Photobacterium damselae]MBE8127745.1 hypothetical protein [Photobacterium damselae subsp. piscicida]AWK84738.1 hypothetical protein BST98_22210 [Photobacterium damselae]KAB1179961.1 hypothetical protein F6450_12310 [Photobacterium damselae subsp. damselae]MCG3826247.1 hypothetical protein [Photobacterium damselae]NVO59959.1 hypothetical protein [Photobacterium damselae subsp. damselae]